MNENLTFDLDFLDSLPGVVALVFLSSNKTLNPFPQRGALGITTPSRQLADPFGKIHSFKRSGHL